MALSLSLACSPPLLQGSHTKKPHSSLAFPAKSFFGSPLAATALSPASPLPRMLSTSGSLAVVAAGKGYKMKTHKASAKRFRVMGTGKIVRRRAGKQHLLGKKNTKCKKMLSKMEAHCAADREGREEKARIVERY